MTDEFLDKLLERLHNLHQIRGHIAALDAADAIRELRQEVEDWKRSAFQWGQWHAALQLERNALAAWQTRHLALHDERSRSQQVNDGI